jgi:MFS family permease
VLGAITITSSLILLTYAIVKAIDYGWSSARTIGMLAVAVAGILAFLVIEHRSKAPLMPLRIWLNRTLAGANVVGFMLGASIFAMFFILSLYMQQVLGYSALKAGVAYLACALTVVVSAGMAGHLVTRFGVRAVLATGMGISAIGLYYFTHVSPNGSYVDDLLPGLVITAIGLGFSFVPVTIAALSGVSNHEAGLASGLINVSQQIGGALGTAIVTSVAVSHFNALKSDGANDDAAWTGGFQWAFWVSLGFTLLGLAATLIMIRRVQLDAEGHAVMVEDDEPDPEPAEPALVRD